MKELVRALTFLSALLDFYFHFARSLTSHSTFESARRMIVFPGWERTCKTLLRLDGEGHWASAVVWEFLMHNQHSGQSISIYNKLATWLRCEAPDLLSKWCASEGARFWIVGALMFSKLNDYVIAMTDATFVNDVWIYLNLRFFFRMHLHKLNEGSMTFYGWCLQNKYVDLFAPVSIVTPVLSCTAVCVKRVPVHAFPWHYSLCWLRPVSKFWSRLFALIYFWGRHCIPRTCEDTTESNGRGRDTLARVLRCSKNQHWPTILRVKETRVSWHPFHPPSSDKTENSHVGLFWQSSILILSGNANWL